MKFDDTELAICQRSTADLFDMTLRIWEKYNWRLLAAYAVGCVPFIALNYLLLSWMVTDDGLASGEMLETSKVLTRWRYFADYTMLTFLELPIAGLLATAFLGQVTFKQNPTTWQLLKSVSQLWGTLIVTLGVMRFAVLGPIFLLFLPRYSSYEPFIELFLLAVLATGLSLLSRTFRPFAPEIIVLERCELLPRDKKQPRYDKRSSWLHTPVSTECFARMGALTMINMGGVVSLLLTYLFFQGVISSSWQWNWLVDFLVIPTVLWSLGGYATVFRFLCYLDSRIALEGWEVELLLRAEANRLHAQAKGGV